MAGPPKLSDVAKRANLSPASVSRYLNGSLKLPSETARRIDAAVEALGYRPHAHARSLSRGRSDVVGLLVPDVADPLFARLAAAVEAAAAARGLGMMLCASRNEPYREIDALARLRRNLVDGILFATRHPDDGALAQAFDAGPRLVLIGEDVEGTAVPKVLCDDRLGGRLAAEHLLAFGHANLAYVGGPRGLTSTRECGVGLAEAARAAGGRIAAERFGDDSRRHGEEATRQILDRHPSVTAILAGSDDIAIGILDAIRGRGLQVGPDLSLVSFGDVGPLDLLEPPVTALRRPVEEMGRRALDRLLDAGTVDIDRLPVELVIRTSVSAPRGHVPRRLA